MKSFVMAAPPLLLVPALLALWAAAGCGKREQRPAPPRASAGLGAMLDRARESARASGAPEAHTSAGLEPLDPEAARCVAGLCAHAAGLSCASPPACEAFCREYTALSPCRPAFRAYVACAEREPRDAWECDVAMTPALKKGLCEEERALFSTCVTTRRPSAP